MNQTANWGENDVQRVYVCVGSQSDLNMEDVIGHSLWYLLNVGLKKSDPISEILFMVHRYETHDKLLR